MTPALQLTDIRKRFGSQTVLRGINLTVQPGAITAVLGPSGGGKSTLLRIIAGFETADEGTVTINGSNATALPPSGATSASCRRRGRSSRTST